MDILKITIVILILLLVIIGVETIIKIKKNEGKKIKQIKKGLTRRINIIIILTVLLAVSSIINIILSNGNMYYNETLKPGYSTNITTEEDKENLKNILKDNNISNVDILFNWIDEFNKEEDQGCGIKNWEKTEKFIYDQYACANRYEKNHEISDGNCRLTAYTLIQNRLITDKKKKDTEGTYLMFDIDVIENNNNYKIVKDNYEAFITLYDEIDISKIKKEELKEALPNKWKEYGIKVRKDNVSLISVVMYDEYSKVLFIGHTGILLKLKDKYMFIEKIAFEQPYQISILKSKADLKNIFKARPTYFGSPNEPGPFIYENDKLLFEY